MKTTALLAILLATSMASAGPLDSNSSLNAGAQRSSPYSADQLAAMYEKNAIKAMAEMRGKVITLSGIVDQIETDAIFFAPQKRATITDIRCELDPATAAAFAKLKVGVHTQITGTVADMKYSVITLTNCKPVR